MKFALIDLGSNSSRMYLLEEEEDGSIRILTRERVMTRLSEGMGDAQRIREDAAARTAAVLKKFHTMAEDAGAKILAVATAAVRKEKNGAAFCETVERETGIRLNVISGQLEAFFDFQGVMAGLPQQKDALICDTGGGSTELILVCNGRIGGRISLPFGAMSLTDRFLREGERSGNAEQVKAALHKTWDGVPFLKEAAGLSLVGLGGSAVALPAIDRILFEHETAAFSPHGYVIKRNHMDAIVHALVTRTPAERTDELGVEQGRADTILGGILPGYTLMERFTLPQTVVCTAGLREGILAMLQREGIAAAFSDLRAFLKKYETLAANPQ